MNPTLTDPQLRTFRLPLTTRLRARIDELRDLVHAQARTIRSREARIRELERLLRRAESQIVDARIQARNTAEGVTAATEIQSDKDSAMT